ncbi:MAG: class I SAM-dependent methyltransferase [Chloroflexaceae bacterium]
MDYRQRFFDRYISTHTAHRDGMITLAQLRQRAAYYQQRWRAFFPTDRSVRILDIGCGNGGLVWWLQQSGYRNVEGIDISKEQVDEALRIGVYNVRQADLQSYLGERHECYDAIVMRDVVEHFTKEEILGALDRCYRALRPGGRLIVQVPNAESPFFGRIRYGDFTHELAFSITSLQQLFAVAGFASVTLHPAEPGITSLRSALRYILWKLVAAFYQLLLFAELGPGKRIVTQGIIAVAVRGCTLQEIRSA